MAPSFRGTNFPSSFTAAGGSHTVGGEEGEMKEGAQLRVEAAEERKGARAVKENIGEWWVELARGEQEEGVRK